MMCIITTCAHEWVALVYENQWYPGSITRVNEDTVKVNAMYCTMMGKNNFKWPTRKDEISYQHNDIVCMIDPPKTKLSTSALQIMIFQM